RMLNFSRPDRRSNPAATRPRRVRASHVSGAGRSPPCVLVGPASCSFHGRAGECAPDSDMAGAGGLAQRGGLHTNIITMLLIMELGRPVAARVACYRWYRASLPPAVELLKGGSTLRRAGLARGPNPPLPVARDAQEVARPAPRSTRRPALPVRRLG